MCLSYCLRQRSLYWNHDDCPATLCEIAAETHGRCETCRHRWRTQCGLTRASLPAAGGCCHHNIEPVAGLLAVTPATLRMLGLRQASDLAVWDAPLTLTGETYRLNLDALALPEIYGLGTEAGHEEAFDWSEWASEWQVE